MGGLQKKDLSPFWNPVEAFKNAGDKIDTIGRMFNPKTPKSTPPAPLPDEAMLAQARRRRLAGIASQGGRDSTILSDTLG